MELGLTIDEVNILDTAIQNYLKAFSNEASNPKADQKITDLQYHGASDLKFVDEHLPKLSSYDLKHPKMKKCLNISRERAGLCLYVVDMLKKYKHIHFSDNFAKNAWNQLEIGLTCVVLGVKSLNDSNILERAHAWERKHKIKK